MAALATAVPVFIGHTEFVPKENGVDSYFIPKRIKSLLEYEMCFGKGFGQVNYVVSFSIPPFPVPPNYTPTIGATYPTNRFFLYDTVRHYFDNGGGPCYIVSVADYNIAPIYGTGTTGLLGGLNAVAKTDEITLITIPDAVAWVGNSSALSNALDATQLGALQQQVLRQCARLQDRFAIFDILDGFNGDIITEIDGANGFRTRIGTGNLSYGAAYYPWLNTSYDTRVSYIQLKTSDGASGLDPLGSNAIFTNDPYVQEIEAWRNNLSDLGILFQFQNPPDPFYTRQVDFYKILLEEYALQRQLVFNPPTGSDARNEFTKLSNFLVEICKVFISAENAGRYNAAVNRLLSDSDLIDSIVALFSIQNNTTFTDPNTGILNQNTDVNSLNGTDWIGGSNPTGSIPPSAVTYTGVPNMAVQHTEDLVDYKKIFQAYALLYKSWAFRYEVLEDQLFENNAFFNQAQQMVMERMAILPPCGAIAGIYATTDRTRGVWKAPANLSLNQTTGPTVKLTNTEQDGLNIHPTGKSINAIRNFTGRGNLVWGARTLAGNDNEWRYISVRRFFIMAEESIKKATQQFVFENNDANTWTKVRSMINNFLTLQWRAGALMGNKPAEAYFVKVGLDETMSNQDILEGRMIVEIGMAVVRPAEFIILQFSHHMQEN